MDMDTTNVLYPQNTVCLLHCVLLIRFVLAKVVSLATTTLLIMRLIIVVSLSQ